jgi:hypothetical protein
VVVELEERVVVVEVMVEVEKTVEMVMVVVVVTKKKTEKQEARNAENGKCLEVLLPSTV